MASVFLIVRINLFRTFPYQFLFDFFSMLILNVSVQVELLLQSFFKKQSFSFFVYSGPLLALGLAREDAINKWRDLLGPPNIEEAKEKDPNW